jgi:small subunit ribosomal protein S6
MQTYESVIVVSPKLSDAEVEDYGANLKKMLVDGGSTVLSEDKWGRRKLAYPIGKIREGYYLYFKFKAKGPLVTKMNKYYRLQETVMRTLTVHAEQPRKHGFKKKVAKPVAKPAVAPAATGAKA